MCYTTLVHERKKIDQHYKLQKSAYNCKDCIVANNRKPKNNEETCRITPNRSILAYANIKINAFGIVAENKYFKTSHIKKPRLLVKHKVFTECSLKRLSQ